MHLLPGVSQSNTVSNGPLGTIQKVGNLQRIQLNETETGLWHIDMTTTRAYTIKVIGEPSCTYLINQCKTKVLANLSLALCNADSKKKYLK